jgi:hypothetical protein
MSLDYRPMLLSHQLFRETVPLMQFALFGNTLRMLGKGVYTQDSNTSNPPFVSKNIQK